jgi:hypothetical protein
MRKLRVLAATRIENLAASEFHSSFLGPKRSVLITDMASS